MFVDQVKIQVKAGKGGDGAVAFGAKNMFLMEDRLGETVVKVAVSS